MSRKILLSFVATFTIAACASAPAMAPNDADGNPALSSNDSGSSFQPTTNDAGASDQQANPTMANTPDATVLDTLMSGDLGAPPPPPADAAPAIQRMDAMMAMQPDTSGLPDPINAKREYAKALGIVPTGVYFITDAGFIGITRATDPRIANHNFFLNKRCPIALLLFMNGQTVGANGNATLAARYATRQEADDALKAGFQAPPPNPGYSTGVVMDEWDPKWIKSATFYYDSAVQTCGAP